MAHTITGIDLGSWSRSSSQCSTWGFRRVRLHTSFEEPVPPGRGPGLVERTSRGPARGRGASAFAVDHSHGVAW